MPSSNIETQERFYQGLGSSIVVQYFVGPIITLRGPVTAMEYIHGQVGAFRDADVISEKRCNFPR
jgi:hypothetical protein